MNPLTLNRNHLDEHSQCFTDEVFKVVGAMGVNPRAKPKLAAYQLNDVA